MIALGIWQGLLDGLGWVLARIYDVIPNYGLTIIVMTLLIRLVLLPLGIKQIKSMQHMQAIQPRIKELQKKYKGNKQKVQEETMRLYKEAGVNPLGGCLPLLLTFPFLIAMYSVIRQPVPNANFTAGGSEPAYINNHLPGDSELYVIVTQHQDTDFLWMNLQCTLLQAGSEVVVTDSDGQPTDQKLACGDSRFPDIVPYVALLVLMIGSTFYQQRQMQKASPPGAQSSQQQAIMKVMPLMFAFFGLSFPAGLVLYWTVSNGFQIAQQAMLLKAGHIGPDALEKRMAEQRAKMAANGGQPKQGFMTRWMEKAEVAAEQRDQTKKGTQSGGARKPTGGAKGGTKGPSGKGTGSKGSGGSKGNRSSDRSNKEPDTDG